MRQDVVAVVGPPGVVGTAAGLLDAPCTRGQDYQAGVRFRRLRRLVCLSASLRLVNTGMTRALHSETLNCAVGFSARWERKSSSMGGMLRTSTTVALELGSIGP